MVGRTLLMMSLLAFLPLSGCLDDGPDGTDAEPLDAAPEGGAEPAGERRVAVEAGNLTPEPQPFSWDGSVGNLVFACAVVTCNGYGSGDWDNTHDVTGTLAGELVMTWDTPNELAFGLATRCDGQCDFVGYGFGASPVSLSFDDLDPERSYILVAWHPYKSAAGVAGTQAGPQTSFSIDGTLMVV